MKLFTFIALLIVGGSLLRGCVFAPDISDADRNEANEAAGSQAEDTGDWDAPTRRSGSNPDPPPDIPNFQSPRY